MARVSKKVSAAQREAENAPHRIWKTAIYARLSDFDDVLRDTESLEVQISYIKEYINHRDDLMLLDVFADKRCTGMNFDRPEFERLLKALQERKIDCIVVKDFSRLGRRRSSRAFALRKRGEKSIPRFHSATKRIKRIIWFWMRKSAMW